jgi:nucleoside-diphosphate-sugar epimerase
MGHGLMNVLVLGGVRFIGRQLIGELLKHGHAVTLLSRGNTRPDLPRGVTSVWGDRTDPAVLERLFSGKNFDVVFDNNVHGFSSVSLFWTAAKGRIGRYTQTSTAWVYALTQPKENQVLTESALSSEKPVSEKEAHKVFEALSLPAETRRYLFEKYEAERAATGMDLPVTILRPGMVSGAGDHNRRVAAFMGRNAGVGDPATFQLLCVTDLARAMVETLSLTGSQRATFNVAPPEKISKADIQRWAEGDSQDAAAADPFVARVPGFFDSSALLKALPSFRFTPAEVWIPQAAAEMRPVEEAKR